MPAPLILEKCDGFYRISLFEEYGIKALFTARKYNMGFEARKKTTPAIDITWPHLVCPSQVHRDSVVIVNDTHRGRGAHHRLSAIPQTDALITDKSQIPIAVLTADCLSVFIVDPRKRIIAIVHAGWRGVHKNIIAKTIQKIIVSFSTQARDLIIVLGPAIRSCCYEVGEEFKRYFKSNLWTRDARLYFDLAGRAVTQLEGCGVGTDHIFDSRLCVSCLNDEFFSYRREGKQAGRSMSVIEIISK